MARYKVGQTIEVEGRRGKIVWVSENPSEIEAMDEYIVEFDNKQRRFQFA
jgi:hypothetical protein